MQLTLRDFFWLTLVLGLTIGILIESKAERQASEWQPKAEFWRHAAEELAQRLKSHGESVEALDEKQIQINDKRGLLILRSSPSRQSLRSTPNHSFFTGKVDLDFLLIASVTLLPASLGMAHLFRKWYPAQGKAFSKFSIRTHGWFAPIAILQWSAMSISAYLNRLPFAGALMLTFAVGVVAVYLSSKVELTPEVERHIDENYEKPLQISSLFKLK